MIFFPQKLFKIQYIMSFMLFILKKISELCPCFKKL
jgi:hypothetical protein